MRNHEGDDASPRLRGGQPNDRPHTLRRGQSETKQSASLPRPGSRALRRCDTLDRVPSHGVLPPPGNNRSSGPERFTGTLPNHRSGSNRFHQGNPDCIPMMEYPETSGPPTLHVPPETWRSATLPNGGGRVSNLPNGGGRGSNLSNGGGRYQYEQGAYNEGIELYAGESTDYYPDDRRTCKTGYIKYNSLSAAKY